MPKTISVRSILIVKGECTFLLPSLFSIELVDLSSFQMLVRLHRLLILLLLLLLLICVLLVLWPSSPLRLRTPQVEHELTIVTAYFPLRKAKHSSSEYLSWLENLLSFCSSPLIIFTSVEFHPILHRLRRNGSLPSFFILDYQSPLEMPPIQPLRSTFERQHRLDPEGVYHSVELYAVWCAKSFMLNRSAELNPFRSKFFLYVDAGAFRSSNYRLEHWPSPDIILPILVDQRVLLGLINPLPRRLCPLNYSMSEGPMKMDLLEGTFMAGSIDAVRWWTSVFYATIVDYLSRDFFIGKDQSIINAIALVHAARLKILLSFRVDCGDVWFAFGPLLAERKEREKLSFSLACQEQKTSHLVIPFETVCQDQRNRL